VARHDKTGGNTKTKKRVAAVKGKDGGFLRRGSWRVLFYGVLLFVLLFVAASFYTDITGQWGRAVSDLCLSSIGGSSIIMLLFAIYFLLSRLFSWQIINSIRQFLGTLLIYALASLLLGLNELTGQTDAVPRWLAPGRFGSGLTSTITDALGAFGTLLLGLAALYLALLLYRIPGVIHIFFLPFAWLARFFTNAGKSSEAPPKPQEEAPNIAQFDGSNYFGNTMTELDEPPLTIIAGSEKKDTAGLALKKNNSSDEFEEGYIQDPTFNIDDEQIDATDELGIFPPPIEIFGGVESLEGEMDEETALPIGEKIVKALEHFNIDSRLAEILVGPTVMQFRIQLAAGIKVSKVAALANDIALALAVPSLRIEAPIPGKPYVGIEIPNPKRRGIPLRTVIESDAYEYSDVSLPLPFGVAVNGDSVVVGLEELPHMLVAGTTGSGKSVFVNACIVGLCSKKTPSELRMILVDPKRVEMSIFDRLPHLLTPPVIDAKKAIHVLGWAVREMESRYTAFAKARVRNIEGFNDKVLPKDRLPYIVIVVDELADLMMTSPKEVEEFICRLAQMARATGIHLLLATQRPSVNVVTGSR